MPHLDPLSLIFTNTLGMLVFSLVLLVSRQSLRSASAGVRSWVVGDLAMGLSRAALIAEIALLTNSAMLPAPLANLPLPALAGGCLVAGLLLHLQALHRVNGWRAAAVPSLLLILLPAAVFATVFTLYPQLSVRLAMIYGVYGLVSVLMLRALWPLRALWGARLIALVMVAGLVDSVVRLVMLVIGLSSTGVDGFPVPDVVDSLGDVVIGIMTSAGFLLLQQERLRERIERLVVTDALTGALNRHGMMPSLERELAQATRHGRELSVVLFDLDHFKLVNDQHGHAVGDTVLCGFAANVQATLRGGDLFGRWGGEEFLLVLPDTRLDVAAAVAERIRQQVALAPVADGAPAVTVSGGAASAVEARQHTEVMLQLLQLADQRLYLAKRQRNRVVAEDSLVE